ncbi:hypothetical protein B0G84_8330 [Paraburkholderia sp. BL8N3]|nr:hypothetical protein [Paraburkholderia sp. BL8N3]TCK32522.1 hypothetical protein B0G84_8330 [Paraburkholderia sp. BL8N3]
MNEIDKRSATLVDRVGEAFGLPERSLIGLALTAVLGGGVLFVVRHLIG